MPAKYESMYARLVANTVVDEEGCWIWRGVQHRGRPRLAMRTAEKSHPVLRNAGRVMLEEVTGYQFPFDEVGHWRCYKTLCINPECIRIETKWENLSGRRGYKPTEGRWLPVLFPTAKKQREEALDAWLDDYFAGKTGVLALPGELPPF